MKQIKLDIQLFANPKLVIDTDLNTRNFENGLGRMQSATKRAGGTIKNIVVGLGITKLIGVAMNQIRNSIDGAVSRVDTLNQFPKVMSNLGISAEEADKSIKKMSKELEGLPTTLDQGARAVQRFTSKNNDVAKSTDLFLALNNAILAGGGSAEIQASALEQLSQSYARGKPDVNEWKTAMVAMPAQLKQVAKAMGYVNADELGEALRNGAVSMDEFMDAIVQLNEKGIDGLASFKVQAKAGTEGIATAITNAKTQVVKGVADIIGALNTRLEKTRFGSLANLIAEAGKKGKEAIDEVAKLISGEISLMDFGAEISDMINKVLLKLNEQFPKMFNKGVELVLEFAKGLLSPQAIQQLISNTIKLSLTIRDTIIDSLPAFIEEGIEIIENIIVGLSNEEPALIDSFFKMMNKMLDILTSNEFLDRVAQAGGRILVSLVKGFILSIPKIYQGIEQLKAKMLSKIGELPAKFFRVGVNIIIGLWNGIKSELGGLNAKFTRSVDGIVSNVKKKLKIKSPSQVFRDEVGAMMAEGLGIGFEDGLRDVYREMQNAIDLEQGKLQANVQTGEIFNTLQNSTPVVINLNADVEMDSQKVGRLVTPAVSRTIKNGGGV